MSRLLIAALSAAALSACAAPQLRPAEASRLAGRVYVVVGASSGFGRGMAERLGQERARVVLAARRADLLEEVATTVRASGGEALVVPTDASDPAQVKALARAAVARFGHVDLWVNDAAVGVERISANIQRAEFAKAGPLPPTSGAVHQPVQEGRGVDGGLRARMKAEDAARKRRR